jgi:hypothetical protein
MSIGANFARQVVRRWPDLDRRLYTWQVGQFIADPAIRAQLAAVVGALDDQLGGGQLVLVAHGASTTICSARSSPAGGGSPTCAALAHPSE